MLPEIIKLIQCSSNWFQDSSGWRTRAWADSISAQKTRIAQAHTQSRKRHPSWGTHVRFGDFETEKS